MSFTTTTLVLLLQLSICSAAAPIFNHRFTVRRRSGAASPRPEQYIDPSLPSFVLPSSPSSCTLSLLRHDFAYTYGSPPVTVNYNPPANCSPPWARVVLDFSVACAGEQYDRVAGVWLDGAELLRTSTAEPTDAGVFWRVRKDITRYSSLLARPDNGVLSVMLENIVDDVYTGVYHVNVSIDFYVSNNSAEYKIDQVVGSYNQRVGRILENLDFQSIEAFEGVELKELLDPSYREPAHLVRPISSESETDGSWFRIYSGSDVHFKSVNIPANTYRAVVEIYVSFHGDDEFWYSNPPDSYIQVNNLTTGRGNGAFRQVFLLIDGKFLGSVVPFPVIFTGGINPLFWEPVVAIGAFDLPSYSLDLTPFLGLLLDGKEHVFGLGVTDSISFWLVDANLHLWLDSNSESTSVVAKVVDYKAPPVSVSRKSNFKYLNGKFKIKASRKSHLSGWVNSSIGNLTTIVDQKLKFKSTVRFEDDGNFKEVKLKAKAKTEIRIKRGDNVVSKTIYHSKYPLEFVTSIPSMENSTYTMTTNLSHVLNEKTTIVQNGVAASVSLIDRQRADGWMLVQDHSVLSGTAGSLQTYEYRNDGGCYSRQINARDGVVISDDSSSSCSVSR